MIKDYSIISVYKNQILLIQKISKNIYKEI